MIGTHESRRKLSPLAQRGYDYCCQIREGINALRQRGQEPRAVWVGTSGAAAMRALWYAACGDSWDGVLPKYIAGVPCREGSTGGHDYMIELFESDTHAHLARQIKNAVFKAQDNPLYGTH